MSGATAGEVYAKRAAFTVGFTPRREFRTLYGAIDAAGYVSTLMNRYNLQQITTPDPADPNGSTKVALTQGRAHARRFIQPARRELFATADARPTASVAVGGAVGRGCGG